MVREDPDLDAPVADVDRQRFERLTQAGFGWADAVALAVHPEADVELALSLVAQGCAPATAAQIVAPMDEPSRSPLAETPSPDEPVRDTADTDAKHLG